jgi:ABC-type glutathione transport system ATPase component
VRDRGLALLLITHDMGVVAQVCDRVAVLYAGRWPRGPVAPIFAAPAHPYTAALIGCIPQDGMAPGSLRGIPGACPRRWLSARLPLSPALPARQRPLPDRPCRRTPRAGGGTVACHHARGPRMTAPLIQIERLSKRFQSGGGLLRARARCWPCATCRFHRQGRAGRRRRKRLRQVHAGPPGPAADRADRGPRQL